MSEHYATIITIHKEPHPNADKLFIQKVAGNNVLVLNSNDWKEGQLAVHIEPDYEVDTKHKAFEWLAPQCKAGENWYRVGVRGMRGVDSFGLAVPLSEFAEFFPHQYIPGRGVLSFPPGVIGVENNTFNVDACPTIRRWVSPTEGKEGGTLARPAKLQTGVYDIEGYAKYANKWFEQGEDVIVTQKLHGSNGSWAFFDDQFWACSHYEVKAPSESSIWWKTLKNTPELQTFLKENQDMVAFGEVYGMNPQHLYGCDKSKGEIKLALFDIKQRTEHGWRWLNHDECMALRDKYNLPWVPVLGVFKYDMDELKKLSSGPSLMPKPEGDIREGIVVKPPIERMYNITDRVIIKFVSPEYLATKADECKPKNKEYVKPNFDVMGVKKVFEHFGRAIKWDVCKETLQKANGNIEEAIKALRGSGETIQHTRDIQPAS